ncbi:mechanosensitive ion channel family protein [Patescibacteria group bacterium]|nr:mechanosensitive ion channel family protein [Patescibacteria group bacterium]
MFSLDFLQYSYFGNTIQNYLIATGIFLVAILATVVFNVIIKGIFIKFAKKTKTELDDTVLQVFNKVFIFIIILGGLYFGLKSIIIPQNIWEVIEKAIQVIFIFKVFQGITILMDFVINAYFYRHLQTKGGFDVNLTRLITRIINAVLWIIGLSLILQIFGYQITALITGLGIGGLAIALAAQDTLGNFFSSVSIIADKPYQIGDIIKFNGYEGTIKDIGMRTTRIDTFFETSISIPNSELAKSIVENISRRKSRRYDGQIGVTYETSVEKLNEAIEIIKKILEDEEGVNNIYYVHFEEYGQYCLQIKMTYYVKNPTEYEFFIKTRSKINFAIKEQFEKAGIEMAFPSQTVYLKK